MADRVTQFAIHQVSFQFPSTFPMFSRRRKKNKQLNPSTVFFTFPVLRRRIFLFSLSLFSISFLFFFFWRWWWWCHFKKRDKQKKNWKRPSHAKCLPVLETHDFSPPPPPIFFLSCRHVYSGPFSSAFLRHFLSSIDEIADKFEFFLRRTWFN